MSHYPMSGKDIPHILSLLAYLDKGELGDGEGIIKKMAGTVQNPKISIGNKIQTLNRIQDNISVNH